MKKNYDFFDIFKHTKVEGKEGFDAENNNYDLSRIDNALKERYLSDPKDAATIKLNSSSYAGITHIRCVDEYNNVMPASDDFDLSNPHVWIFNIEKANIANKAVIVEVTKDIKSGRKEYGDNPNEGAAVDTAICFNPVNGVVVVPPRSGMGISNILTYFRKISLDQGLVSTIVRDSTNVSNLTGLSKIKEINIRISDIADNKDTKDAGIALYNKLKNQKLSLKLYGGDMNISRVKSYIKKLIRLTSEDATVEKVQINGEYNDTHQLFDLIDNRMVATEEIQIDGKITIDQMMDTVYKAYSDNQMKLDISHNIKGGKGV